MVCNRWSKQIKGSVGNATINNPVQSCGLPRLAAISVFFFSAIFLLVGRFTKENQNKNTITDLIYDCEEISLPLLPYSQFTNVTVSIKTTI